MSRRAVDLARAAERLEAAAEHEAGAAVREALSEISVMRGGLRQSAVGMSKGRDAQFGAAIALAFAGDFFQARLLAADLEKRFPEDTLVRSSYLPAVGALIAMNRGNASQAIDLLQVTSPYELGWQGANSIGFAGSLYPVYIRGLAYLTRRNGAEAAAEFQKILDNPGVVVADPIAVLARLQLARASSLAGDRAKAKTAYQSFLAIWKDADPDIPIFRQATKEYAKLH